MDQGGDLFGAEGGITPADDVLEVLGGDFRGRDVERQDIVGKVDKGEILPRLPVGRDGDFFGNVQAAVGCKTLENDLFKRELLCFKPSAVSSLCGPDCATCPRRRGKTNGGCLHRCLRRGCSDSAGTRCASGPRSHWE